MAKTDELTASEACAYLFANGNAIFFDEAGERLPPTAASGSGTTRLRFTRSPVQITELQALGLCGLHGFAERYPEATVHWATWGKYAEVIPHNLLPWLLRHLRREPTERPDG